MINKYKQKIGHVSVHQ